MNVNFSLGSGVVLHLTNFYLTLFVGFEYRVDERAGGFAIGYLGDDERLTI